MKAKCAFCGKSKGVYPFPLMLKGARERALLLGVQGPSKGDLAHPECTLKFNNQLARLKKRRGLQ